MKNIGVRLLLIIMILSSFFSGYPLKGRWSFVYQFEFIDYPEAINCCIKDYKDVFFWGVVVVSHIGFSVLPFLNIERRYFKKMLLYLPLSYLLGYLILLPPMIFLLIPFIGFWVMAMVDIKKLKT